MHGITTAKDSEQYQSFHGNALEVKTLTQVIYPAAPSVNFVGREPIRCKDRTGCFRLYDVPAVKRALPRKLSDHVPSGSVWMAFVDMGNCVKLNGTKGFVLHAGKMKEFPEIGEPLESAAAFRTRTV